MTGGGVIYGGSVLAAVVAGAVALLAPCCISVMLPAYFASSFHNRRVLVAMTFLFAAGVASVVLPIALGAAVVQRLLVGQHTLIWSAGGALLLGLGGYTLAGGRLRLPMPGRSVKTGRRAGPLAVYSLAVFSGVASACCAPVLAGVVALSGLAASFGRAVGLGGAYVFGMVAPLFLLALWWERRDWQTSRLLRPRSLTWRIGGVRRTVSGTGLASGLLLVAMGGATVWIALTGSPMAPAGGWQARLSAWVQHAGTVVVRALAWLPGWAAWLLLATAAGLLAWRASGRSAGGTPAPAKRAVSNPRRQVMSTKSPKPSGRARPPETGRPDGRPAARRPRRPRGRLRGGLPAGVKVAAFAGLAVIGLLAVFLVTNRGGRSQQGTGRYAYQVGDPGPGATAPPIRLEATDGKVFDLAAPPGQTTLLYFQEGLGCQPCWDQLTDIQTNLDKYKALGITRILSITSDPLDAIAQKVTDQRITIPVAADPDLAVSRAYHANQYGMMGQSRDGHSFILVGPDGRIRWRADYGGAPNYTMYVPSPSLLADLRAGVAGTTR